MSRVLYFTAPWCSPCKALGPIMEGLGSQMPYQKINIDEDNELSLRYSVRSVPTLIKVDSNGNQLGDRLVGLANQQEIKNWYNG